MEPRCLVAPKLGFHGKRADTIDGGAPQVKRDGGTTTIKGQRLIIAKRGLGMAQGAHQQAAGKHPAYEQGVRLHQHRDLGGGTSAGPVDRADSP